MIFTQVSMRQQLAVFGRGDSVSWIGVMRRHIRHSAKKKKRKIAFSNGIVLQDGHVCMGGDGDVRPITMGFSQSITQPPKTRNLLY